MTILEDGDRLVARRCQPDDRIEPTHKTGRHGDLWIHRKTRHRYLRHDDVHDMELDLPCHDYSSWEDGRLWLRPIAEWEQDEGAGPRFERHP